MVALSPWRFTRLLAVGLVHARFWVGDILVAYALCAPVVLLVRRLPTGVLATAGVVLALAVGAAAVVVDRVAAALPLRPLRVGLAQRDLPFAPAAAKATHRQHLSAVPRGHARSFGDDR